MYGRSNIPVYAMACSWVERVIPYSVHGLFSIFMPYSRQILLGFYKYKLYYTTGALQQQWALDFDKL